MSSDIRLVHSLGDGHRIGHGEGTDEAQLAHLRTGSVATRAIDITTANRPPPVLPVTQNNQPVTDRPTTQQPVTGQPAQRPVPAVPKDNFAKANPAAWDRFMADTLDVAAALEEAAKDGKVDAGEWDAIFAKANKDGKVSLMEIAGMYACLQDMHDKGILDDGDYHDATASLDAELTARYDGGAGAGLDHLAQLYIEHLGDEHDGIEGDHDTKVTMRDDIHGRGHAFGHDRIPGHDRIDHEQGDHDEVTRTNHRMQQVNDDREDGAISRTRQEMRRHDVSAGIATALTDIGINRRVTEISAGRRGEGRRDDL